MRPLYGDELIIENALRPKDLNCDPYPRQMTHADRVFLYERGISLHMLSWRDGYYWKARERTESGVPERVFAQQLNWSVLPGRVPHNVRRLLHGPRHCYFSTTVIVGLALMWSMNTSLLGEIMITVVPLPMLPVPSAPIE
jgi:hypothetical protein